MKTLKASTIPVLLALLVAGGVSVQAPDSETSSQILAPDSHQRVFEGAARCKTCHRKPEQGEQFGIWESSSHAQAYMALASEEAMAIATERGIANPQEADECLKCHVTGHGVAAEFFGSKYTKEEGVGCESCHGAGGDYYKKKTMVAITSGELDPAEVGLITPDETVCTGCHNEESPTYEGFDYEAAVAEIAHPIPDERKAEYQ
jgi:hypothetical protein